MAELGANYIVGDWIEIVGSIEDVTRDLDLAQAIFRAKDGCLGGIAQNFSQLGCAVETFTFQNALDEQPAVVRLEEFVFPFELSLRWTLRSHGQVLKF